MWEVVSGRCRCPGLAFTFCTRVHGAELCSAARRKTYLFLKNKLKIHIFWVRLFHPVVSFFFFIVITIIIYTTAFLSAVAQGAVTGVSLVIIGVIQ